MYTDVKLHALDCNVIISLQINIILQDMTERMTERNKISPEIWLVCNSMYIEYTEFTRTIDTLLHAVTSHNTIYTVTMGQVLATSLIYFEQQNSKWFAHVQPSYWQTLALTSWMSLG